MSLLREMRSSRSQFSNPQEEALLNLVATSELLGKLGAQFLRPHGVSRAHFNILLLLRYEGAEGLKQVEISRRLIITSANVSVLLDRLEARGWITREMIDRRTNLVRLSPAGRQVLDQVEPIYNQRVIQVMSGLDASELNALTRLLEKLRGGLMALAGSAKQNAPVNQAAPAK
ncbi:MAG TPA: MarR family transcriptional regulator [Planctomycetota bacterium]|nr:MarR family transcriptional regulator [Planctomycetota bacterium]